jgi:hypothetical protein
MINYINTHTFAALLTPSPLDSAPKKKRSIVSGRNFSFHQIGRIADVFQAFAMKYSHHLKS